MNELFGYGCLNYKLCIEIICIIHLGISNIKSVKQQTYLIQSLHASIES